MRNFQSFNSDLGTQLFSSRQSLPNILLALSEPPHSKASTIKPFSWIRFNLVFFHSHSLVSPSQYPPLLSTQTTPLPFRYSEFHLPLPLTSNLPSDSTSSPPFSQSSPPAYSSPKPAPPDSDSSDNELDEDVIEEQRLRDAEDALYQPTFSFSNEG